MFDSFSYIQSNCVFNTGRKRRGWGKKGGRRGGEEGEGEGDKELKIKEKRVEIFSMERKEGKKNKKREELTVRKEME